MKAFQMDDYTVYAANTVDEAMQVYFDDTGETCDDGYPRLLSDETLDAPMPETDENEAPTGNMTTLRAYLDEMTEAGFLAGET